MGVPAAPQPVTVTDCLQQLHTLNQHLADHTLPEQDTRARIDEWLLELYDALKAERPA